MELTADEIDIGTRSPTVLLNSIDASELGVHPLDRIRIRHDGRVTTGIVEVTDELVDPGSLGVTRPLGHITGAVEVSIAPRPDSVAYLMKKLDDVELEMGELDAVVRDINNDRLNDVELSAFVSAVYTHGLSREETMCLTNAMVDVGETIEWNRDLVVDKHSIGGVAGNRVTPIVVAIVAAAGLTIPKTSSRAVTSAAGTADTMEVFCDVDFSVTEIKSIVGETNGCVVWGGAVNLSPVDDKIIRAETPLSLDPPGQVIASVLSKKKSAGATNVVIDIPYGEGAKVESLSEAREMAEDFSHVGTNLGMEIDCTITRGEQPIGRGIGPTLEARDVLSVLEGSGPPDLRVKSERLAQVLLDAASLDETAVDIVESGRAAAKFREIVAAQNGDPDVAVEDLEPGAHDSTVLAGRSGVITHVDNRHVNELARRAGAPKDHRAGVRLEHRVGDEVQEGDPLLTVYAEKEEKLDQALSFATQRKPVRVLPPDEALIEQM
ncbi:AMP phosphorylase [Halobellus sp. H-GB7]|uniref:AMP phosphorylase n=1 Tax=Halobellus sp. H-GB7 TaxID=3069756 RepID=UPI0027B30890|nr:AMP phosphorylase [Halobellus sp. H-GB7]MDQ2054360.1 AMP phosphorylase [Halobellus sp. H-GB7]